MTDTTLICWICGKTITLPERKSDDRGPSVHKNCYMAVVLGETRSPFVPLSESEIFKMMKSSPP